MGWAKYGSKRKVKPIYKGIQLDSSEEVEFYMWLEEAKEYGYISEFEFHNKDFQLIESRKIPCSKALFKQGYLTLRGCRYELDFKFKPNIKFNEFEHCLVLDQDGWYYVDTKSPFKGAETVFSIKQKLVYEHYATYVNRVVPLDFFKKTWRPRLAGLTEKKRDVQKKYQGIKTIKEL